MAQKAYSTIETYLGMNDWNGSSDPTYAQIFASTSVEGASSFNKLCKIKSYPDLGGSPDLLETTDLEDFKQTFVPGVQTQSELTFTANFNPTDYRAVLASSYEYSNALHAYEVAFGDGSKDTSGNATIIQRFRWIGKHSVYVNGNGVNEVREMTITCIPESEIFPEGNISSGGGGSNPANPG